MSKFNFELLMLPAIQQRLRVEAKDPLWKAFLRAPNGSVSTLTGRKPLPPPWAPQQLFCAELVNALQQLLAHDGAWITLLSAPIVHPLWLAGEASRYQNITALWVDADGDVQFAWEIDDIFERIAQESIDRWLNEAERAWQLWRYHMRTVPDIKNGQTFKKAQGQVAPSDA